MQIELYIKNETIEKNKVQLLTANSANSAKIVN